MRQKNFLINTVILSLLVVVLLLAVSAVEVPEGSSVRRINILSRVVEDSSIDNTVAYLISGSSKNVSRSSNSTTQSQMNELAHDLHHKSGVNHIKLNRSEILAIEFEDIQIRPTDSNTLSTIFDDDNIVSQFDDHVCINCGSKVDGVDSSIDDYDFDVRVHECTGDRLSNLTQVGQNSETAKSRYKYQTDSILQVANAKSEMYGIVGIEDYSCIGHLDGGMIDFWQKLKDCKSGILQHRPLRIMMLGDSFIESDLLSSDLRSKLQSQFGGHGLGYVQVASPQAPFSRNIRHQWDGWKCNSAMVKTKGGIGYLPSLINYTTNGSSDEGQSNKNTAFVEWSVDTIKQSMLQYEVARIAYSYKGSGSTTLGVKINGEQRREIAIVGSQSGDHSQLQSVDLGKELGGKQKIYKLRIDVPQSTNFVVHGVWLESRNGVALDNLSLRGNSGALVANIDAKLTRELQKISPTDLIVLSYGLNVVEANRLDYSKYMQQMQTAVDNLKYAMPGVPILILGVSDRLTRTNHGKMTTMAGVRALEKEQRLFAQRNGLGFWSMYDAMQKLGGMQKFVDNGWAAKDYTHIGLGGGRRLANELYEAIMLEYNNYCELIKKNSRNALVLKSVGVANSNSPNDLCSGDV